MTIRPELLQQAHDTGLLPAFLAAHSFFANRYGAPEIWWDAVAEPLACLLDATREDEALGMLDDWEARLGLPSDIRADLSAWIVDRHYINARG